MPAMSETFAKAQRLKHFARDLRSNQTSAEKSLWRALRGKRLEQFRFRRQVPMCGYIVDFACFEARLVVEVDGATHSTDEEVAYDRLRESALRSNGNAVLLFTNDDIHRNLEGVVETALVKLRELRPREHVESANGLCDPPP